MATPPSPRMPQRGYNLLAGMMAELVYLLHDVGDTKYTDMLSTNGNPCQFDIRFEKLLNCAKNSKENRQYEKLMKIRPKLTEYANHLIQIKSLLELPGCSLDDLEVFRQWHFNLVDGGKSCLKSAEASVWVRGEGIESDLTSLSGHGQDQDVLSRFLDRKILSWLNSIFLHKFSRNRMTVYDQFLDTKAETQVNIYSDGIVPAVSAVMSVTLASLLLTLSMFVLIYVKRQVVRLGLILVFDMLFCATYMLLTKGKGAESFAVAAAFAAIQVVFVSNNNSAVASPAPA